MKLFWIKISRRQGQEPQGLPVSGGWEELTLPVKYSKGWGVGWRRGLWAAPCRGTLPTWETYGSQTTFMCLVPTISFL